VVLSPQGKVSLVSEMSRQFLDQIHIQSPPCSTLCNKIHYPARNLRSAELLRREAPAPAPAPQTQVRCLQSSTSRRLKTSKATIAKTSASAVRKSRRETAALEWQINETNGCSTDTPACTAFESTKRNETKRRHKQDPKT
jgi:hypothetical protein